MKILLIRTSALGDIVHCLPVLTALRRALPTAKIGWVVEQVWAPLLEGHPHLDALFRVRTKAWRKRWSTATREIRSAIGALRAFQADVAIDLMGNHKGALLARASGAARTVGARGEDRREGSSAWWIGERVATPGIHAVDRALALLAPLGVAAAEADFGGDLLLQPTPPAAEAALADQERVGKPLVLIQAGAGWINKIYPRWPEVARGLGDDGFDVVLPSAPGEDGLVAGIADRSGGAARVVDATDFRVLAALQRRARLVLGGDTGPIHLAHALGTRVLCVIGPTDPGRNGPYDAAEQVVFHPLPCSYCYQRFAEAKACLLEIPPARILERARALLNGAPDG